MTQKPFITIEGIDGVGKSTHATFLAECLQNKGEKVTLTREPGGTDLGEKLRRILLDAQTPLCVDTTVLLMFAARAEHIQQIIKPALKNGQWVICDRFTDATMAYQGGGQGARLDKIALLAQWTHERLQPTLTFLIDLLPEKALARLLKKKQDRFESQTLEFYARVRHTYLRLAKESPQRFFLVDGNQPMDDVKKQILDELNKRFFE